MRSGVYRADDFRGDAVEIDLKDQAPLEAIARALEFPAWFGRNWDALEDCLGDLSWRQAPETLLVFRNFKYGDELGILIDILCSTAQFWDRETTAGQGKRFVAVFVDPRRELELPELPASA